MWSRRNPPPPPPGPPRPWPPRDMPPRDMPPDMPPPDHSRVAVLYAVTLITCLLVATFVIARFYINHRFRIPPRSEGWAILVAGVLAWAAGGVEIWRFTLGFGKQFVDIGPMNQSLLRDVSLLPIYTHTKLKYSPFSFFLFSLRKKKLIIVRQDILNPALID